MNENKIIHITLFCLLLLTACNPDKSDSEPVTPEGRSLVILHDNDVHCAVTGYVHMAGWRDAIVEADTSYVAMVSSGDFLQGGAMGAFSQGEYIVDLMNAVGYDAVTIGNHEFDYGIARMTEVLGKLQAPVTCVNFVNTQSGKEIYTPYVMKQMGNKQVAFVGTVTPSTLENEAYAFVDDNHKPLPYDLQRSEIVTLVQQAANEARKAGADYVVVLSHLGEHDFGDGVTSTSLIQQTTGINAVLDGHTHSLIPEKWYLNADGDSVLVTQTGTQFSHFGKLVIDTSGRCHSECIPLADMAELTDARTEAVLDSIQAESDEVMGKMVLYSDFALPAKDSEGAWLVRNAEAAIGNFITDAFRDICGTQTAVVNGGGIRASLPAGIITYKSLYDVQPYGNNLSILRVTGEQITQMLEESCALYPDMNSSFLQVSGLKYCFDPTAPLGHHVQSIEILADDGTYKPLAASETYSLATIDYIIDTAYYETLKDATRVADKFLTDIDCVVRYAEKFNGVMPARYADVEGRIQVTSGQ